MSGFFKKLFSRKKSNGKPKIFKQNQPTHKPNGLPVNIVQKVNNKGVPYYGIDPQSPYYENNIDPENTRNIVSVNTDKIVKLVKEKGIGNNETNLGIIPELNLTGHQVNYLKAMERAMEQHPECRGVMPKFQQDCLNKTRRFCRMPAYSRNRGCVKKYRGRAGSQTRRKH